MTIFILKKMNLIKTSIKMTKNLRYKIRNKLSRY